MLRARQVDVVVARTAVAAPGLEVVALPPTPAALAVPADHRLAGSDAVELAAIDGERLLTWSPQGTPYTDMLVARCESAGARVTPVESAVTGGSGMVELAALEAVALVPATWPAVDGVVVVGLRGNVTLPLLAVRAVGVASPAAARLLEALRGA